MKGETLRCLLKIATWILCFFFFYYVCRSYVWGAFMKDEMKISGEPMN